MYTPHRKYQVKSQSSPCFSASCADAVAHRNHFFRLYRQNRFSESKVQAWNYGERALEAVKIAYCNNMKESMFSQKFCFRDFHMY